MEDIKKALPEGIKIDTVYDRTELVDLVMNTVRLNLMEGAWATVVKLVTVRTSPAW